MVCGELISVAAVGVVPGARRREAMQKCGYYPGIPRFLQVYPQNTRYFADFADFAAKMHSDSLVVSVRQDPIDTTF